MVFSEKFALFANSVAYFSWIIFFNSIFKWLKPRLIENNLILAKNPKNQCLKFSDFSTKSGSVVKGLVILKLNVPNFGPFYYLRYFSCLFRFRINSFNTLMMPENDPFTYEMMFWKSSKVCCVLTKTNFLHISSKAFWLLSLNIFVLP